MSLLLSTPLERNIFNIYNLLVLHATFLIPYSAFILLAVQNDCHVDCLVPKAEIARRSWIGMSTMIPPTNGAWTLIVKYKNSQNQENISSSLKDNMEKLRY